MAQVFLSVEVCFAIGVAHVTDTHSCSHFLQFAVVVYFTGQAIQRMIRQHQFDDVAAKFEDCAQFAKWPAAKSKQVIATVRKLEELTDIRRLTALLSA